MSKKGEFGEPWRYENRCLLSRDDDITYDLNGSDASRIVSCVNALDGRNPSALPSLEVAVQMLLARVENVISDDPVGWANTVQILRVSLADFGVEK